MPANWQHTMGRPVLLPDGTWLVTGYGNNEPPLPSAVTRTAPLGMLAVSTDGFAWTTPVDAPTTTNIASVGNYLLATIGSYEGPWDVWESTDGGHTWSSVTDSSGNTISGDYLCAVGNHFLAVGTTSSGGFPGRIAWIGTAGVH